MKKVFMLLMLCVSMLLPGLTVPVAAEEQWQAEGTFGEDVRATNMSAQMTVAGSGAPVTTVGGRSAWTLKAPNWYYHTMYVNVGANVKVNGGKHLLVEVDYFDSSDESWFCIIYNSRDGKNVMTPKEKMNASQKWKTASFVLEAPTMSDDLNGGDFGICTEIEYDYSHKDVYIGGVRARVIDEIKPADIRISLENIGHIYFSNEEIKVKLEIENKLSEAYDADVNLVAYDISGEAVYTQPEAVSLKPLETVTKDITLNLDRLGVFMLYAEGTNEELGYRFTGYTQMSRLAYNEYQNDMFGACNHLGWHQAERKPEIVFPIMRKTGMGWTRDEILWRDFEKQKGKYVLTQRHKDMLNYANENNIKHLLIAFAGNTLYTDTINTVPIEDYQLEAFGKYLYNLVTQTKEYGVNDFEYWNEYGSHDTVTDGADQDFYVKLAKVYSENILAANPDANRIGFTTAGTGLNIIKHTFDQGTYNHVSDISYHVYSNGKPEDTGVDADTKSIRDLINKYPGGEDMEIWLTECGFANGVNSSFAGYYDKHDQAKYIVEEFAIQVGAGVDKMFVYSMLDERNDPDDCGSTWGLTEYWGSADREVPYAAKPALAAISAMNSVLGTPEFVEKIMMGNDKVHAFHYKRTQDGKDTSIIWGKEKSAYITLNLGTDDAKIYDMYGNEVPVKAENGEYSFAVKDEPMYIIGEFNAFAEGSPKVAISATNIKTAYEDEISIGLYKSFDQPLNIDVSVRDDSEIEIQQIGSFDSRAKKLMFKVKGNPGYSEPITIKVTDDSGKEYYTGDVIIEYVDGLGISGRTRLYQDSNIRRWQMQLDIDSRFHKEALKGKVKIIEPAAFAGREYNIGPLKTGENTVLFHLPEVPSFTSYKFKAEVSLSNGYKQTFTTPIDFALSFKAEKPPEIDGVMSPGEWKSSGKIVSNRQDQTDMIIKNPPWRGIKDLSCETYLMWDEEYFYLAFKAVDDIFSCDYGAGSLHKGDSVQFTTSYSKENVKDEVPTFTEFSMALTPEGELIDKNRAETGVTLDKSGTVVKIIRDEDTKITQYEMKVPWKEILPEGVTISENMEVGFAMLVNDNDTFGRRGWIEFGSGLGRNKNARDFARIRLMDNN